MRPIDQYWELSGEIHDEGVRFMSSMTDKEFCHWIITNCNDRNARDSMIIAAIREGAIERIEGME